MLKEFKEFAMKGNVMDLAVGVIIGGAFQKIVSSLVDDIIMPAISMITGKIDYSDLAFTVGDVSIKYGSFLTAILDFLIIAFSVFLIVKYLNRMRELSEGKLKTNKLLKKIVKDDGQVVEEVVEEPTTKICPFCLSEINIKASRCPHCTSELENKENV
ncbi:MAG: large conductance mechanosensitive channel protein MscL [Clostridia bacterium]|nr:large conductance mechanosensitive channel protein MscL [Clostridia bacterium]